MKQELIQGFLIKNGDCFDPIMAQTIQQELTTVDDSKAALFLGLSLQKPTVVLIIAIFFGIDRFFLDEIGLGILKVLTCYGCGIWWLIDIFTAKKRTVDYNYKKFNEVLMLCK